MISSMKMRKQVSATENLFCLISPIAVMGWGVEVPHLIQAQWWQEVSQEQIWEENVKRKIATTLARRQDKLGKFKKQKVDQHCWIVIKGNEK